MALTVVCAWNPTQKCHFNFALCTYLTVLTSHHLVGCLPRSLKLWGRQATAAMLTTERPSKKEVVHLQNCDTSTSRNTFLILRLMNKKTTILDFISWKFLFHHSQCFTCSINAFYGFSARWKSKRCSTFLVVYTRLACILWVCSQWQYRIVATLSYFRTKGCFCRNLKWKLILFSFFYVTNGVFQNGKYKMLKWLSPSRLTAAIKAKEKKPATNLVACKWEWERVVVSVFCSRGQTFRAWWCVTLAAVSEVVARLAVALWSFLWL